ncbi:unnamed protein product [Miscanthus lutarioriparius]|uniref:Pentatricopeptide repeat-containing protein n=1 Tax=Miscanthus lutarioriparius TaxID=422564 RepID=A0A811NT46_9POAL|nr:unnamed protein product [Miscanthus lutarioriparius]
MAAVRVPRRGPSVRGPAPPAPRAPRRVGPPRRIPRRDHVPRLPLRSRPGRAAPGRPAPPPRLRAAPLPCFNAALSLPHALALPLFRRLLAAHSPDAFSFPPLFSSAPTSPHLLALHALALRFGLAHDLFCASALLRRCLRFGLADHAHRLFDELRHRDVVVWNSMLNGFVKLGCFDRATECFRKMREEGGVEISSFTVTAILSVCTATADLRRGAAVHGLSVKSGFDKEASVCNALIDLYGKCHQVHDATMVFEGLPDTDKDLFSWNSMLSAHQYSVDHMGTMRVFARMRRTALLPDAVTVAAVLPACAQTAALQVGREVHGYIVTSGLACDGALDVFACNALADIHSGLLEEGKGFLKRMKEEFGLEPQLEHYACVTDMLGRAGRLDEARKVIEEAVDVGAGAWRTYLAACRMHGDKERAQEAARMLMMAEESGSGGWVLLANTYGWDGNFEELKEVSQ